MAGKASCIACIQGFIAMSFRPEMSGIYQSDPHFPGGKQFMVFGVPGYKCVCPSLGSVEQQSGAGPGTNRYGLDLPVSYREF